MSAAALPAGDARPLNTASTKPVPEGFSSVLEGSSSIIHETGHVFYNPAQVQNRDLSIACLNVFSKIYRQEKEALAAKRSSRHAAQSTRVSPTAASGEVAAVDAAGEYKGLRILEGAFRRTLCAVFAPAFTNHFTRHASTSPPPTNAPTTLCTNQAHPC
jgi:hypothetical protein